MFNLRCGRRKCNVTKAFNITKNEIANLLGSSTLRFAFSKEDT